MYDANISSGYPFNSQYVTVNGSKLHYIEEGQGDILFLHGIPSWSYLCCNVITHLSKHARCISLDFDSPRNRLSLWRAPQELPIVGETANVVKLVEEYNQWLRKTSLPILLFHVDQGAFVSKEKLHLCDSNLNNLMTYDLGKGAYWYIEDYPHTIGNELLNWYQKLA